MVVWISCVERLPEQDGEYKIVRISGEKLIICMDQFDHGQWGFNNVIAWMLYD